MTDPVVHHREARALGFRPARGNPSCCWQPFADLLGPLGWLVLPRSTSRFPTTINHAPEIARTGTATLAAGSYRIYQDPEDVDYPLPPSRVHIKGSHVGRLQASRIDRLDSRSVGHLSTHVHEGRSTGSMLMETGSVFPGGRRRSVLLGEGTSQFPKTMPASERVPITVALHAQLRRLTVPVCTESQRGSKVSPLGD